MKALYRHEVLELLDARRRELPVTSAEIGKPVFTIDVLIQRPTGEELSVEAFWLEPVCLGQYDLLKALIKNMAAVPDCVREYINTLDF